jgi:acyl-CoA synthetase
MNTVLSLQDVDRSRSFYERGYWTAETMYMRLRGWAERQPEHFFLRDSNSRLTYREALQWTDAIAASLHEAGVRPGQRVSIWLPSQVESVLILLACSRMGYVCNPSLHRDYTCADVVALLERAGSAALFAQPGYGADSADKDVFGMLGDLKALKKAYRVPALSTAATKSPSIRCGSIEANANDAPPFSTHPDRVMYLAFTSGTTGLPKGVMHSDNTLLSNGRAIAKDFGFDAATVIYTLSPMSHNMGTIGLVTTLACGGEFVVHTPLDAKRTLDRILETKATYLIGVPTHAIDLLAEMHRRGLDRLGNVTSFQLSGAPIPGETVRALMALDITVQNCFGMTENCSFQYTKPGDPAETIINTCGRSCDGFELKLWKQDNCDEEVTPGEIGELGGRGSCLMLGYFNDQAATENSFSRDGWFMTGDLGQMDEHNNVRIVGRKKDLIIRGGHNIHPARIEDFTMRHAQVMKAAAFPIADMRLGERVCLAVVLKERGSIGPEALLAHLDRMGLSKYDMPEFFIEMESFPLTASGKVLKRRLVELAKAGSIQPHPVRWQASATVKGGE